MMKIYTMRGEAREVITWQLKICSDSPLFSFSLDPATFFFFLLLHGKVIKEGNGGDSSNRTQKREESFWQPAEDLHLLDVLPAFLSLAHKHFPGVCPARLHDSSRKHLLKSWYVFFPSLSFPFFAFSLSLSSGYKFGPFVSTLTRALAFSRLLFLLHCLRWRSRERQIPERSGGHYRGREHLLLG